MTHSTRWSRGVAVITSALHAAGRQFDPGRLHIQLYVFDCFYQPACRLSINQLAGLRYEAQRIIVTAPCSNEYNATNPYETLVQRAT